MHVIVTIRFEVFSLGVEYMQIVETHDAENKGGIIPPYPKPQARCAQHRLLKLVRLCSWSNVSAL